MPQPALLRRPKIARALNIAWSCLLASALLCLHAFALDPEWNIYQFGHRSWKIDDGYLGSRADAIAQDRDGYLWIGTANGLFRFDGVRFTQWNPPGDSPSFGSVLSLLVDRDGSLWIGSDHGLSHWGRHRLTRYKDRAGLLVYSIVQDENGAVWFAPVSFTNSEEDIFCKVASEKLTCFGKKDGLPPPAPSFKILRDASGTFWIARGDSILSWRKGATRIYSPKQLRNNSNQGGVADIAVDTDGSLFVGISKQGPGLGLQRFRNGRFSTVTAPGFDGSRHSVLSLFVDQHHALWISTIDEGIYRLYRGRVDHFGHLDGLSSDFTRAVFEDREGSIWICTGEGVDQLRDLAVRSFSRTAYPKAREFDNLVTLPDGRMWIGGDGVLYTLANGSNRFISQARSIEGKQVTTIFGDREGHVWVGLDNTLNLFDNGRFLPVKLMDGRPAGFIVSMTEDAAGSLFAITTSPSRTLLTIDAHALRASAVLPALDASKIAADPRDGIWIGTNTGAIQHLSEGKTTSYSITSRPGTRIAQLAVTSRGEVLAAGNFGLASVAGGAVHILGVKNGLPCSYVNNFLFDTTGNLWLYMACGLVKLSAAELRQWRDDSNAQLSLRLFDSSDGFKVSRPPFEGAARSADGRLWFNNQQALMMVDPSHMHINAMPPPVHIQAIRADFHGHALAEDVQLPRLTRDIEIDLAALSFVAPEKIRFRYRLTGFDQQWHDIGSRRQAVYMNLKPGTYSFQAIAANNDGIWNLQGDTLSFTIPPTFYQTDWFLACVVLAGLLLIYALFIVRLRVSTSLVEGRMHERLLERDRIARDLHDTLLQGFHGIVLRLHGTAKLLPDPSPARLSLEDTIDRADEILIDSRRSLLQLRSSAGASSSLSEQLHRTVADLRLQKDILCEIQIQGQERTLKPTVQEEVVSMVREAVTNAFRHSQANRIAVVLDFAPTLFTILCQDDGVGLPSGVLKTGAAEGRWGLVGLRERAQNIRARLVLRNNEPHGTVVEILLSARIAYAHGRMQQLMWLMPGSRK
ncbi:MAG TPA: two-component regulator propeller domain-containing protein [Terracidiphilus sp.]|nr:two-component regulator propeller domain-containing protein [Terracidiphilus sp.]